MADIPRDPSFDASLALLNNGYRFIRERCDQLGSDVFKTRLMLRRFICVSGEEAARMFYHPDRFTRRGSMPPTVLMALQDRGSVQQLDGAQHRHRKAMFMSLMSPAAIARLGDIFDNEWQTRLAHWQRQPQVVLQKEVELLLCRAACRWAGVALNALDARKRTGEFAAMIDGAGSLGPRSWRGLGLRMRTEHWARSVIQRVRDSPLSPTEPTPIEVIALHRDADGHPLPVRIAAVELLNVLRPMVAVARFITFGALALHQHPQYRQTLLDADDAWLDMFTLEVRRFYPFFPVIAGIVRDEFEWRGYSFSKGTRVMLDLHGTNHDPRSWQQPDLFQPERFKDWQGNAYNLIPQGGGAYESGHRCAGEWITIELINRALRNLVSAMEYRVPPQDLSIDMGRLPTIPASGFIIDQVRNKQ
tara:strand:+ start:657 stop:1907 length:1251 start_codon:yes stop_codon:yes gene_type:complete